METLWHLKLQGQNRSVFVCLIMNSIFYVIDVLLLCFFIESWLDGLWCLLPLCICTWPLLLLFKHCVPFWYLWSLVMMEKHDMNLTYVSSIILIQNWVCKMQTVMTWCEKCLIYLHGGRRHDHISVNSNKKKNCSKKSIAQMKCLPSSKKV